jgi:hypothetical protein
MVQSEMRWQKNGAMQLMFNGCLILVGLGLKIHVRGKT